MSDLTFEAMLRLAEKQNSKPRRKPHKHEEHDIQVACVNWFRREYPHLAKSLFAVPNGGKRDKIIGGQLKAEGALAGVLDLILLHPINDCGALLIEVKTESGELSTNQKEWIKHISQFGYICVVVRSLEDFKVVITDYLKGNFNELKYYANGKHK